MPDGRFCVLLELVLAVAMTMRWPPMIEQWRPLIEHAARREQIDPALIAAIIQLESGGDRNAVRYESSVGASSIGLMQIVDFEFRKLERGQLMDPAYNIDYGTRLLAIIRRMAGGDVRLALAAYNCGFEGARTDNCGRWGGYVYADNVLATCRKFGGCTPPAQRLRTGAIAQ